MPNSVLIKTFLAYKNVSVMDLDHVESNPMTYFYEITDDEQLYYNFITLGFDSKLPDYIEGVLYIEIDYCEFIGFRLWDYIFYFWAIIPLWVNGFLENGINSLTFPGQNIELVIENYASDHRYVNLCLSYAKNTRRKTILRDVFFKELFEAGALFFIQMGIVPVLKKSCDENLKQLTKVREEYEAKYGVL